MSAAASSGAWRTVNLGPASRVPAGEGKVFEVDGLRVAIFRSRDGRVFATEPTCPHRGGPLADGLLGGSTLACPLHAFRFDLSTGAAAAGDCRPLVTYPVSLSAAGELLLRLAPA